MKAAAIIPPMVITVPPRLAAKLRERLAELELPDSYLCGDVRDYINDMLVDDDFLTGGWVYPSLAAAERVAARFFKRCPGYCIKLAFGADGQVATFMDPNLRKVTPPSAPRTAVISDGKVLLSKEAARYIVSDAESLLENTSMPSAGLSGLHGRSLLKAYRKHCRERIRKSPDQRDEFQGNLALVKDEVEGPYLEACDALGLPDVTEPPCALRLVS